MSAARTRIAAPVPVPWRHGLRSSSSAVIERLARLSRYEMADAVDILRQQLARRGHGRDVRPLMLALERLGPEHEDAPGIPIPLVRRVFPIVPRAELDALLLHAEALGLVVLVRLDHAPRAIERAGGLLHAKRGLLYFCAPVDGSSGPGSQRRRLDQEAGVLLRQLAALEDAAHAFVEVDVRIARILEARSAALVTDGKDVLRKVADLAAWYRRVPGVPLSVLRAAFPNLPRPAFDRSVRALEAQRRLRLYEVILPAPFVDPFAAIEDPRGLFYYCAVDLGRS
ncbi:hypothetical protein [Polyangium sp. y55x31]|uniref:hypothetical protein n=1 Tax=Polyangium sp. y55x31 TaxID=3042688 RepID=UPI00248228A6|nr:hypothetical protein [Polyangium sp. y55x31]MDI1475394.1 hypothetical protein [Polyangium sp. y55x31]